jgi:hypothetical protein
MADPMARYSQGTQRVLAIDPTYRGYAFAVLEGPHALIEWGVSRVAPKEKNKRCVQSIEEKILRYEPEVVVLEDYGKTGSRRSSRVRTLIEELDLLAAKRRIAHRRFSRNRIRTIFQFVGKPNKEAIAKAIAERFPELRLRLPRPRGKWRPEEERMNIFDAVSLALAYFGPKAVQKEESAA